MTGPYSDYRMNEAYGEGVADALAELERHEPDAADREWWDSQPHPPIPSSSQLVNDWADEQRREREADELARMHQEWAREDVADALDWFWNGPR